MNSIASVLTIIQQFSPQEQLNLRLVSKFFELVYFKNRQESVVLDLNYPHQYFNLERIQKLVTTYDGFKINIRDLTFNDIEVLLPLFSGLLDVSYQKKLYLNFKETTCNQDQINELIQRLENINLKIYQIQIFWLSTLKTYYEFSLKDETYELHAMQYKCEELQIVNASLIFQRDHLVLPCKTLSLIECSVEGNPNIVRYQKLGFNKLIINGMFDDSCIALFHDQLREIILHEPVVFNAQHYIEKEIEKLKGLEYVEFTHFQGQQKRLTPLNRIIDRIPSWKIRGPKMLVCLDINFIGLFKGGNSKERIMECEKVIIDSNVIKALKISLVWDPQSQFDMEDAYYPTKSFRLDEKILKKFTMISRALLDQSQTSIIFIAKCVEKQDEVQSEQE
ncbi:UNKNOWN [Stylonychia lemnae]|uniref:Uncharacterized protein n=1 Tax=Stylonychia lemnae TaxID=5949 RepID=A0A078A334_STYLE|nr:UNKNOWN [Stylonychia lemnae]|eukprot:CDW75908.1 UNKNOWN [Stylonychia lemnae]